MFLVAFLFRPIRVWVEKQNSIVLASKFTNLSYNYFLITGKTLPYFLRMQVDFFQLWNPLEQSNEMPFIEVVIPCTEKDLAMLPFSLASVRENSRNPISKITLVTPSQCVEKTKEQFPNLEILSDEQVLSQELIDELKKIVPPKRWGWSIQQLVKLAFAQTSEAKGVLIWDSDTLLTRPTIWLDSSGKQLLMFSHEYHRAYVENTSKYWGAGGKSRGMSFVTHHQLMKPNIVKDMFPNGDSAYIEWLRNCDWKTGSAFSEYHSYGTWISNNHPDKFAIGVWGNHSEFRHKFLAQVKEPIMVRDWVKANHPGARSISFHDYMN